MKAIKACIVFLICTLGVETLAQEPTPETNDIFPNSQEQTEARLARYAKAQAESNLIDAMKFYALGDYKEALEALMQSDKAVPNTASIQHQISKVYYKLEDYEKAVSYAQKAIEFDQTNLFFYEFLIELFRAQEDYKRVVEISEQLLAKMESPQRDYYFDLASAYIQLEDYKKALKVFEEIEQAFGVNNQLIDLKQRCLLSMGDADKAIRIGEQYLEVAENEQEYYETHIQFLMSLNQYTTAKEHLTTYEQQFGQTSQWHMFMLHVSTIENDNEAFFEHAKVAFKNPSIPFDDKVRHVLRYFPFENSQTGNAALGKELTQIIYETHPDQAKAYELYAEFLLMQEDIQEARTILLKSLELDENNFEVWQKIVELDVELGDYNALLTHTEDAIIIYPNQAYFFLFNGLAHQVQNNHEEAIAVLEQAQMLAVNDNKAFQLQLQTQLGDAYHHVEEYEKSNAAYDAALAIDANNTHVLNNYSYYLAIRNENLDKAHKLAKRLLSLSPSNPHYLDTYGWVLYAQEKYQEALPYLEKAASAAPQNAAIAEHLGDVLYKLGNADKAVEQWQKAKELGGNYSKSLERKLKERKLN